MWIVVAKSLVVLRAGHPSSWCLHQEPRSDSQETSFLIGLLHATNPTPEDSEYTFMEISGAGQGRQPAADPVFIFTGPVVVDRVSSSNPPPAPRSHVSVR